MSSIPLDHGGNLDSAAKHYGGKRQDWLDLSTGINPEAYSLNSVQEADWKALPDKLANTEICLAARKFWNVPDRADILAVPGCSSAIAQIPTLFSPGSVEIAVPTYNEHAASFQFHGWQTLTKSKSAQARVIVHPNNPTGKFSELPDPAPLNIIDESFCDIAPLRSHIARSAMPGHIILKSFGKFWGLAGLRLGFAIGDPFLIKALRQKLGPWPVSGIALRIGTKALQDYDWANNTRNRLKIDIARLDTLLMTLKAKPIGDCSLFRTYAVEDAAQIQKQFAESLIWSRIFPYSNDWIRLGLPPKYDWSRLENAL